MRFYDLIEKKKRGESLSREEVFDFVRSVTDGIAPDYQISAFLMAVFFQGMTDEETYFLTDAMAHSGDVLSRGGITGTVADKHSTGGVSDSTTLVLVPILCGLGVKCAKLSGRGLGHTGGTLDKLESFSGLTVDLDAERFTAQVNEIGAAIAGQTQSTVPADKKLYALRDVTATVDSIPLIASSVMSKKLASFADIILLDVKFGTGAFMKDKESALLLARTMVQIGRLAGRKVAAVVTDMNQPLAPLVGCNAEVRAAIGALKGEDSLLARLSKELCVRILVMDGWEKQQAMRAVQKRIDDGSALQSLRQMICAQGGSAEEIDDFHKLSFAPLQKEIYAQQDGVVDMDATLIGLSATDLGGGREKKDDVIDHGAGIELFVMRGQKVARGDLLAKAYALQEGKLEKGAKRLQSAFTYCAQVAVGPLIAAEVDSDGIVKEYEL